MELIHIGPFELEISQNATLKMPDGVDYVITLPEANILKKLHSDIDSLVPRKELELAGWGEDNSIGVNSLAVAISNLRKILKLGGVKIINEPKRGYKIVLSDADVPGSEIFTIDKSYVDNEMSKGRSRKYRNGNIIKIVCILFLMSISCMFVFYFSMSWVYVKCESIFSNDVCYLTSQENDLGKIKFKKDSNIYLATAEEYIEVIDDK
ncbi:winged helix-turn-helix domain-containing protein [Vibrio crassostreae]|uniref:winged helix-turn-helix domain-containing protein n=1 Tax=Vibrio crassostreae TaxID=246167 RepID=UPI000F4ADC46|nr:winged helix-turn-helix domain-containing protein [Vibrio crassostreae]ROO77089.1 transcriptional regulator [Vibrio crassostreae]ROR75340.1 transcriptional regulator [Vibrio crassostreae]TCV32789.1 transcriptional regulator [Vibrio crassostreae]